MKSGRFHPITAVLGAAFLMLQAHGALARQDEPLPSAPPLLAQPLVAPAEVPSQVAPPLAPEPDVVETIPVTDEMSDPLRAAIQLYNGGAPALDDQKIVGGDEAVPGKDPWQVALIYTTPRAVIPFCGGSIVAERWIVTAAHCVERMKSFGVHVLSGATNLDLIASGQRLAVKEIYIHSDFARVPRGVERVLENDIALLELTAPTTSRAIAPVSFEEAQGIMPGATPVRVTGWGATAPRPRTATGGAMQRKLRAVSLVVIDRNDCNDPVSYGGLISSAMICAGFRTAVRDACNGDSGGPLTAEVADQRLLLGIVSWGHGCAQPEKFGVYTRVDAFKTWIDECVGGPVCPRRKP
jgi:secreted trypsin-like serine protease